MTDPTQLIASSRAHLAAGRTANAIADLRRAAAAAPTDPAPLVELGIIAQRARQDEAALGLFRRALDLDPRNTRARLGYASSLYVLMRLDEAADLLREGIALNPGDPDLRRTAAGIMCYTDGAAPAEITGHLAAWGRLTAMAIPELAEPPANHRDPDRRLRIAYLCQDISRNSAIARFVAAPILHLDREQFDVFGYCTQPTIDRMSPRLAAAVEGGWTDVSNFNDAALVRRLRADRVDILIETAGHTPGNRLLALARRAAPIQITCIGDPKTTGLPTMDYRIIDAVTDPPRADALCAEKLIRLPHCFLCYEPNEEAPPPRTPWPGSAVTSNAPITFGSFNVPAKLSPMTLATWARILAAVPHSRLILKPAGDRPATAASIHAAFARAGIDPGRVGCLPFTPSPRDHLAAYHGIDIALDPFPYNGTTTTCDALWMGVPVVTLLGTSHPSRVGASLLAAAGVPELVASSYEDFIARAARLAAEPPHLAELHRTLRPRLSASRLCDAAGYAASLNDALRHAWRSWVANP